MWPATLEVPCVDLPVRDFLPDASPPDERLTLSVELPPGCAIWTARHDDFVAASEGGREVWRPLELLALAVAGEQGLLTAERAQALLDRRVAEGCDFDASLVFGREVERNEWLRATSRHDHEWTMGDVARAFGDEIFGSRRAHKPENLRDPDRFNIDEVATFSLQQLHAIHDVAHKFMSDSQWNDYLTFLEAAKTQVAAKQ